MAGRGGARKGSGRKKKTVVARSDRAQAEGLIRGKLARLVANLIRMADEGDYKANAYLIDQLIGSAKGRLEHGGDVNSPIKIVVEYADVLAGPIADPDSSPAASGSADDPE